MTDLWAALALVAVLEGLVLFVILWWFTASPRPRLAPSGLFLLCYGAFRFAVEFVRGNPEAALGLTRSQWFLLVTGPLIAWYFARQVRSGAYGTQPPDPAPTPVPATRDGERDD